MELLVVLLVLLDPDLDPVLDFEIEIGFGSGEDEMGR